MELTFYESNFRQICNKLSRKDPELKFILQSYGYPPFWSRSNSFATLIHVILEQQVSLASARAALDKLKKKLGTVTPIKLLSLSDAEMKACYFSRQKIVYARHLAASIISGQINLRKFAVLPDDEIRLELKKIKGIGDWTVDVYLLFALHRANIFPTGDLAMMKALKEVKKLSPGTSNEKVIAIAESWQPYRSVAAMLLWHYYIQKRGIRLRV